MLLGVDLGAPRRARDQRKKLVAIAASRVGPRAYRVEGDGFKVEELGILDSIQ